MFQETSEGLGAPLGNVGSGQWAPGRLTEECGDVAAPWPQARRGGMGELQFLADSGKPFHHNDIVRNEIPTSVERLYITDGKQNRSQPVSLSLTMDTLWASPSHKTVTQIMFPVAVRQVERGLVIICDPLQFDSLDIAFK